MKRFLSRILIVTGFLTAVSTSCRKPAPEGQEKPGDKTVAVASVSVSPASLDLVVGNSATLVATVLPAGATDPSVSWSSSNTGVATVSQSGEVTAVAPGQATITVKTKDGGKTATCAVTVTPVHVAVESISIDPSSQSVEKGKSVQLTATVLPVDASEPSVQWSSSDETVAKVSQDGLVTALGLGQAVISIASVEDGTKKAQCAVTVVKPTDVIWYRSYKDELVEPFAYGGIGHPLSNSIVDGWGELVFESSIRFLGERVFYNCTELTEVILPAKVESLGNSAFGGCTSLVDITLPEGLVTLDESAFDGCHSLVKMVLPGSLTSVGIGAFSRCASLQAFDSSLASADGRCLMMDGTLVAFAPAGLEDYSIPAGTKVIASSTFKYCTKLQTITIPATVERIGEYAFYNCTALTSATFEGTTPPEIGKDVFLDVDRSFRIYVPSSAVATYKKAAGWRPYASKIFASD